MSTSGASENRAFREEVRAFIRRALSADMAERIRRSAHPHRNDVSAWMKCLHERGWAAVGWPEEFGGPGWDGAKRIIFEEECLAADAPPQHFANIHSIGPVIYTYGSPEQKQRFLAPLLRGDEVWCQGFSEPNAGSDLGSLTTRAVLADGHYVVNGQKTWTSDAQDADWMFALVRTGADAKPARSISFLLMPMDAPGLTVRPIRMIDGSHPVNEVFLDDVRVPAANLVGSEGQGWEIAKFLLLNERAFSAEVPYTKRDLRRLIAIAKKEPSPSRPIWNDPLFRAKVTMLWCDVLALEKAVLRALPENGAAAPRVAPILKISGSELRQRVSELMVEALGPHGIKLDPGVDDARAFPAPEHARGVSATSLYRRATTIYGGTNEIQRDIIARTMLDL